MENIIESKNYLKFYNNGVDPADPVSRVGYSLPPKSFNTLSETLTRYVVYSLADFPEENGSCISQPRPLRPVQIFIDGTNNYFPKVRELDLEKIRILVTKYHLPLYIHAPFTINMAKFGNKNVVVGEESLSGGPSKASEIDVATEVQLQSGLKAAVRNLTYGAQMAARGVVIHVGKSVKLPVAGALRNMEAIIRELLNYASAKTPLLLETPAGAGTETLTSFAEFADFYARFSDREHERFKVCIDTCHIWSADHEPLKYLQDFAARFGADKIGLVHFNDSQRAKNARIDRHAFYGEGKIGAKRLKQVAQWCVDNNIDMVFE